MSQRVRTTFKEQKHCTKEQPNDLNDKKQCRAI